MEGVRNALIGLATMDWVVQVRSDDRGQVAGSRLAEVAGVTHGLGATGLFSAVCRLVGWALGRLSSASG